MNRAQGALTVAGLVLLSACGGETPSTAGGVSIGGQVVGAPLTAEQQQAGFVSLTPHVIVDRQGWGEPMDYARLLVPSGWTVRSDVVWYAGATCGPGVAEPVMQMISPDGLSAIEIAGGMQFMITQSQNDLSRVPAELHGPMQASMAQLRASQQQAEQDFRRRGDGCHVGTVNSALEAAQRYVLPYRRPNARVVAARPLPQTREPLQAMVERINAAMPVQGLQSYADAVSLDLELPAQNGVAVVERMSFGVVGSRMTTPAFGMLGGGELGGTTVDTLSTTPVVSVRAPRERFAQTEALATAVLASVRVNPQWQAAMDQLNAELSRIRAQGSREALAAQARRGEIAAAARAQVADEQMRAWQTGQDSRQRSHDAFIDRIYDSNGFVDPQTGARVRAPYGQQAFSNGQGGVAIGPQGATPGGGWTAMQPAPTS